MQGAFKSANFVKDKYYLTALEYKLNLRKLVSIGLCFFIIVSILPISFAHGAGITTFSITGSGASNGIDNATSSSAISTAIRPSINFVLPGAVLVGDTVSITLNGTVTSSTITEAKTGITVNSGTCSDTSETAFTVNSAVTNPVIPITGIVCSAGADLSFIFSSDGSATGTSILTTSSTGGNYELVVTTANDYGNILYYIGDTNDVRVTAVVQPILTFTIRNTADTAEQPTVAGQKLCDLGTLSITTVNTCSYRLKVGSNAISGYSVSYDSDGNLTNGSYPITNAAAGSNGSAIGSYPAGTELYGIVLAEGKATHNNADINRGTDFSTTTSNVYQITKTTGPIPVVSSTSFNAPSATDTVNTSLVTHRAVIDADVRTGNYSHIVTYTVSGTF